MSYLTYDELVADAEKYKADLTKQASDQVTEIKSNFDAASSIKSSDGILRPQVIVEEKKSYVGLFALVAILGYLFYKGKLKL